MIDFENYKSWLWIPLTLKQKFELYLKSIRQRERELISLLFIFEFKLGNHKQELIFQKEIESMQKFNKYVDGTLNNLMYEKYIKAWENQTTKEKLENLVKHLKETPKYFTDHQSFIRFFHETYFKSIKIISNLELESKTTLQNKQKKSNNKLRHIFDH